MNCKGLCHEQCSVVPMTAAEVDALQRAAGRTFDVYPSPVSHTGQEARFIITPPGSLRCPALTADNRCSGYEGRPALCRIYGQTKAMRCPHGCVPERWLTDRECGELLGMQLP